MTINLDPWQLVLLAISFVTFLISLARYFLAQIDKRFSDQEARRTEYSKHWDALFLKMGEKQDVNAERTIDLERRFLQAQLDMAINYVRREDYVRGQTTIEAKLDALALRLQNRVSP